MWRCGVCYCICAGVMCLRIGLVALSALFLSLLYSLTNKKVPYPPWIKRLTDKILLPEHVRALKQLILLQIFFAEVGDLWDRTSRSGSMPGGVEIQTEAVDPRSAEGDGRGTPPCKGKIIYTGELCWFLPRSEMNYHLQCFSHKAQNWIYTVYHKLQGKAVLYIAVLVLCLICFAFQFCNNDQLYIVPNKIRQIAIAVTLLVDKTVQIYAPLWGLVT